MSVESILGLIASIFTIGETVKTNVPLINRFSKKRKINLDNWKSDDIVTQARLDEFKSKLPAQYKEKIFTEEEINSIIKDFFDEKKNATITESEKETLEFNIRDIFSKYNEYTLSQMSPGEKVILHRIEDSQSKTNKKLDQLLSQNNDENEKKFKKATEISKSIKLNNIDSKIKDEYEIDRNELIKKIKSDNNQIICICGNAGAGKSALGKKLLYSEKYVLYARAEQLCSSKSIDDIWDCEIEESIKKIENDKIYFFIDALEYIADIQNTISKIELLQSLFEITQKQKNIYIITTCRSSDINAFAKTFTKYNVQQYKVEDLTEKEIEKICETYPLIKELQKSDKYSALLKTPLYINIILSKILSTKNIKNECDLRKAIWDDVVCLKSKAKNYGLKFLSIRKTIEKIVFTRAKQFQLGIDRNDLDEDILKKLESEGIISFNEDLVRLKHDLFEDICFENKFDKLFEKCNGEYPLFFKNIKKFGRCAYRRYQIWVSNKLFAKDSREKFLFQLVFNNNVDENWQKQTIIGIVKSEYCHDFLYDYYTKLLTSGLLLKFIRIINLYAFDAKPFESASGYHFLQLIPTGNARESIIQLICENLSYDIDKESIIKLCDDYSKSENRDLETSKAACEILEFYVAEKRNDKSEFWEMVIPRAIKPLLSAIYKMADASKDWIKGFFSEIIEKLQSIDRREQHFSEKIAEWTIKDCEFSLIKVLPDEMGKLAKKLWLSFDYNPQEDFYGREKEKMFGLSLCAKDYIFSSSFSDDEPIEMKNLFFAFLLKCDFWKAFYWAVDFINSSISYFASVQPNETKKIELTFVDSGLKQTYWGHLKLWLCASHENEIPLLLGDVIYLLKKSIIKYLEVLNDGKDDSFCRFASKIRFEIYKHSNNIALLSIINYIGLHFLKELPGYAVDLATNMDLIWWDISRSSLHHKDESQKILERQISQAIMGVPLLKKRYELDEKCDVCLRDYVRISLLQLQNETVKEKCRKILNYLYSITKNNDEQANQYLQIQIMEGCAYTEENSDTIKDSKHQINGAAKELVKQCKEYDVPIRKFLTNYAEALRDKDNQLINETIDFAIEQSKKDDYFKLQTENKTIQLVFCALANINLKQERRDYLCRIWIDGIRKYLKRESFVSDNNLVGALWVQLRMGVSNQVKNEIKKLMLDILTLQEHNGIILDLSKTIKRILSYEGCKDIARPFFNTILMLAKDEMNHQKYNAAYIEKERGGFVYKPNMHRLLWNVDEILQEKALPAYKSHKNEIICQYLYKEEHLVIEDFNIDDYDISTLCFVANCGLDLKDPLFAKVVKEILKCMIRIWEQIQNQNGAEELLEYRQREEVEELLRREIVKKNTNDDYTAIDLLLDNIDFPVLSKETERFYSDIFGYMQCAYFDNSDHPEKRHDIERKMLYIGQKVENHPNESLKRFFYKVLCFCLRSSYVKNPKQFKVKYSYQDKHFINEQLKKYGKYDIEEMFYGICNLNEEELLPDILDAIDISLKEAEKETSISDQLKNSMQIANIITTAAFVKYSDEIKKDKNLTGAFERILDTLVNVGDEQSAWLLDEFRLH